MLVCGSCRACFSIPKETLEIANKQNIPSFPYALTSVSLFLFASPPSPVTFLWLQHCNRFLCLAALRSTAPNGSEINVCTTEIHCVHGLHVSKKNFPFAVRMMALKRGVYSALLNGQHLMKAKFCTNKQTNNPKQNPKYFILVFRIMEMVKCSARLEHWSIMFPDDF